MWFRGGRGWLGYLLAFSLAVPGQGVSGQAGFVAIPPDLKALYHLDFARLYFKTEQAEQADRRGWQERIEAFDADVVHFADTGPGMLRALRAYDSLLVRFFRHDDYLWLHYNTNTGDRVSADGSAALEARIRRTNELLRGALRTADSALVGRYMAEVPELARYRYLFASAHREAAHVLAAEREALLAELGPVTTGWQDPLYEQVLAGADFGSIDTPEGRLRVGPNYASIRVSPDAKVRADGFNHLLQGYEGRRDLFAFALINTARAGNTLARLHRFPDRASQVYFSSYLTLDQVSRLVARVADSSAVNRDYEQLLADRYTAATGVGEGHGWDLSAPLAGTPTPRFTITRATRVIEEATSPLGSSYRDALGELLDPHNGRMDVVPGPDRRGGGFSTGFIGTPSAFYTSGFEGFYRDVSRLAHESTHAVERTLMTQAGVLPSYADGPHPLSESFAEFAELLLADRLYRDADDPALKAYYLRQFMDVKGIHELYSAASEVALEQAIYAGVSRGEVTGADDLDSLTLAVESKYSRWPEREPVRKGMWMTKVLFFEDPFYTVNYVYAALLAIKYFDLYSRDSADFAPRYTALMAHSRDAPPAELLQRYLGIDLHDDGLLDGALQRYRERIEALRRIDPGG